MVYLSDVWRKVKKPLTYVLAIAGLLAIGYGSCQGIKAVTGRKGTTIEKIVTTEDNKNSKNLTVEARATVNIPIPSNYVYISKQDTITKRDTDTVYVFITKQNTTPAPTPGPKSEWTGQIPPEEQKKIEQPYVPTHEKPAIDF